MLLSFSFRLVQRGEGKVCDAFGLAATLLALVCDIIKKEIRLISKRIVN